MPALVRTTPLPYFEFTEIDDSEASELDRPNRHFRATSLGHAWELGVLALVQDDAATLVDSSTGGPALELESIQFDIAQPLNEPQVSMHYPVPDLIDDYVGLFSPTGGARPYDARTIADRIYRWDTPDGGLDQFAAVVKELRAHPRSRRAVLTLWDPAQDLLPGGTPLGHCLASLSVRDSVLNMTLVSRSVDAWLGAMPNMIAFLSLMQAIAAELEVGVGTFTQFIFSYHIYLRDVSAAQNLLGATP